MRYLKLLLAGVLGLFMLDLIVNLAIGLTFLAPEMQGARIGFLVFGGIGLGVLACWENDFDGVRTGGSPMRKG